MKGMSTQPSSSVKKTEDFEISTEIPGFRESGMVPTDYEVAAGLERYELLKKLKGEGIVYEDGLTEHRYFCRLD